MRNKKDGMMLVNGIIFSAWLSGVGTLHKNLGSSGMEKFFSNCKDMPQYKYLARPVYKLTASLSNPVLATAVSFFATDLIMHQLLPQMFNCAVKGTPLEFEWIPGQSLCWMCMGVPVMYSKFKRSASPETIEKINRLAQRAGLPILIQKEEVKSTPAAVL